MNDVLSNATLSATAVVPIIIALVQMFKMTGWIKDRFAPFLSVGLGILIALFFADDFLNNYGAIILTGIIYGLSASGLYSAISTTTEAIKMDRIQKAQEEKNNQSSKNKR